MKQGIYRIGSEEETFYVGRSLHVPYRLTSHRRELVTGVHFNPYLQRVYNKYPEKFTHWEMVEFVEDKTLLPKREAFWIKKLSSRCNLMLPVEGEEVFTASQETRERMSRAGKGRPKSPETIQRMIESSRRVKEEREAGLRPHQVAWNKGRTSEVDARIPSGFKRTERARLLTSQSLMGREVPREVREKISDSVRRAYADPEFKEEHRESIREGMRRSGASEKISRAGKGRVAWNKGIPRTDEVKRKLSEDWAKRPIEVCPECGGEYKMVSIHAAKAHRGKK